MEKRYASNQERGNYGGYSEEGQYPSQTGSVRPIGSQSDRSAEETAGSSVDGGDKAPVYPI